MRPKGDPLPHNSRVNMHAQRRAGWTGGSLAQVVRCIREATAGTFGGWLTRYWSMGRDRFYFTFPVSHLFPVTRAESAKR
jgi:hypothetical protein